MLKPIEAKERPEIIGYGKIRIIGRARNGVADEIYNGQ